MTLDLETRLRRAAEHLDEVVSGRMTELPTVVDVARPPSPRRRWVAAAAAAAVVLVGGTLVVTIANSQDDDPPATDPTVPPTAPAPTTTPPTTEPGIAGSTWLHEGWNELPEAPLGVRYGHHTVATENGVLVWGGVRPGQQAGSITPLDDGAFLDMTTGEWTRTPAAPASSVGANADGTAVAVGNEVIFLVENSDTLESFSYKTSTNTWESIPAPPDSMWPGPSLAAFAVGADVVFVRQARRADSTDDEPFEPGAVAVFDTTGRTWSEGSAPADTLSAPREGNLGLWGTVAGDRVVVAFPTGGNSEDRCQPPMLTYAPSTDEWQPLKYTSGASAPIGGLTFTGSELFGAASDECLVFDGPANQVTQPRAVLTDLVTGSSRVVDAPTLVTSREGTWTGSMVATTGDRGDPLLYEPGSDRWHAAPLNIDVSGLQVDIHREWVLAGGAMVAWGGTRGSVDASTTPTPEQIVSDGYAYVPPAQLAADPTAPAEPLTGDGLVLPTGPPDRESFEEALARGTLVVEAGCVVLVTGDGRALILWPAGTSAISSTELRLPSGTVLDLDDGVEHSLGGGYSAATSEEVRRNEELAECVDATAATEVYVFSGALD